jgi:hypothetical protein
MLLDLSANLEVLRERATAPELTGSAASMELHARSIKGSVQRLVTGRERSKRLEENTAGSDIV